MAYDWNTIRQEYIQGNIDKKGNRTKPSLKQLCDKYGCNYNTIRHRAANEKWNQKKHLFDTKLTQKIEEKAQNKISDEAVDFDSKSLDTANKGIDKIYQRLNTENLSNHDLVKLSLGLANYQRVGKISLGEPTDHVKTEGKTEVEGKVDVEHEIPGEIIKAFGDLAAHRGTTRNTETTTSEDDSEV